MHVILIGGTGHIGTYLVPRLVEAGHRVTVISRGGKKPYQPHGAWQFVELVEMDRQVEEAGGVFGEKIAAMKPDVVIDLICFELESARQLVEALRGKGCRLLHCSTVWVHGETTKIPVSEDAPRRPIGSYGEKKAAIEAYLQEETRRGGLPSACILPGHISGPGWVSLNPAANFNPEVYVRLGRGEEVCLPGNGTAVVHHVHADDVAQLFMLALQNWNAAQGESFHAVSPAALTLRGFAEAAAGWFGRKAVLRFLPMEEYAQTVSAEDASSTFAHLEHSPNCYSIEKSRRLLGYQPRYTSLQAVRESVYWLIQNGKISLRS